MFSEYSRFDGLGLAELVARREVSPRELTEEAIARIGRVNRDLNAVVTPLFEDARRVADGAGANSLPDGPFRGVPFLVKDLTATMKGVRQTEGSRFFADHVADHDSTLVARYRRAGVVIVGKTNTPEFGLAPFTEPVLHGPTHTPWKLGHTSGGSSGGSAAAVAAGIVPMAHGGDGGGSLRIPASCCGIFALMPSRGRMPHGPDHSEAWFGFATEHVLSRSVRDSAAMLDATHGPDAGAVYLAPPPVRPFLDEVALPPGKLRVGLTRTPYLPGVVHADCTTAVEDAARLLESLGHNVEEVDLAIDPQQFASDLFTHICVAVAMGVAQGEALLGKRATAAEFEAATWLCNLLGRQHPASAVALAKERLQALSRRIAGFFDSHDVLLSPTLARPPVKHGELVPHGAEAAMQSFIAHMNLSMALRLPGVVDRTLERVFEFMPFTPLANVTGRPSMSVPLFWNGDGLPVGVMVTGGVGDEATLFRLAGQLEQARPWAGRKPPVHSDRA